MAEKKLVAKWTEHPDPFRSTGGPRVVKLALVRKVGDQSRLGKVTALKGPGLADGRPSIAVVKWLSGRPKRTEEHIQTLKVVHTPGQSRKAGK